MSDCNSNPVKIKARKQHQCIGCLHKIEVGEEYMQQSGIYDGEPYRNRYHHECWDYLSSDGEFEFMPGDCPPPERLAHSNLSKNTLTRSDT